MRLATRWGPDTTSRRGSSWRSPALAAAGRGRALPGVLREGPGPPRRRPEADACPKAPRGRGRGALDRRLALERGQFGLAEAALEARCASPGRRGRGPCQTARLDYQCGKLDGYRDASRAGRGRRATLPLAPPQPLVDRRRRLPDRRDARCAGAGPGASPGRRPRLARGGEPRDMLRPVRQPMPAMARPPATSAAPRPGGLASPGSVSRLRF